ncbi:MAG: SAM-dependent methyltransferase [Erythrobacter sp.]
MGANLEEVFRRLIRETGPITLAQYMGECNSHYYNARDPLSSAGNAGGDFITAPEISQMFGELIGLWLADIWTRAGRPDPVHYVELGPGRGTLASDALRAMSAHGLKPQVHLVEGSVALLSVQSAALLDVIHHTDASTLPDDAPLMIVANEFFDALAIHQLLRTENGWRERMIGLEDDALAFVAGDRPMDDAVPDHWRNAEEGTLIESAPAAAAIMSELADRLVAQGGAALIVDYGTPELHAGSTFQAVAGHRKVDPLANPGEADLTAHVDFGALAEVARRQGAKPVGIATQGAWLNAMGIDMRAQALAKAAPEKIEKIARQRARLADDAQMGSLFKVLGITAPDWPNGAGF